ncbi:MAG: nitrate reductase molybdenum cofactor assembly chaperone [Burkholderiaceae bacterium]|nr:nitrate reductase molybdenum cofactor assembly chaperone [Burkholderiaceae bacterium]
MKAAMNPLSCRALARLLGYPDDALRVQLPELRAALQAERAFSPAARGALDALVHWLAASDRYEVQEAYVDCFDRGRSTSLWLFEHVHGDSRERGQAMVDLARTYEAAELYLGEGELPDYLPVVLEFASTQSPEIARSFLRETAPILASLHGALVRRGSRYSAAIGAALELAGERVAHAAPPAEEAVEPFHEAGVEPPHGASVVPLLDAGVEPPLDATWAEPPAFDGCSLAGQSRPDAPQPIHIVRRRGDAMPPAPGSGAST